MSCPYNNISIVRGNSFLIYASATNIDGTPTILSGYLVSGHIKNNFSDTGYLYNLNTSIYSAESGILAISGNSQSTQNLPYGSFFYSVNIYDGLGGYASQVSNGDFLIYPDITN